MTQNGRGKSDDLLKIDVDEDVESHRTQLQEVLSTQWRNGQFCDLRVKYADGSLDVHACVLYGFCTNLGSISVDCFDATSKELNLESYDVIDSGIRPIITYLYTGSLVVKNDPDVLIEVRNCAKLMGLKKIESICQNYLKLENDMDVTVSFENGTQTSTSSSPKSPKRTARKRGRPTKKKKSRPQITEKENGHGDSGNLCLNAVNREGVDTSINVVKEENVSDDDEPQRTERDRSRYYGDSGNLCPYREVGDTSINVVKVEDVSDEEEPQGTGSKRRIRLSNLQTAESLQSILKVEDDAHEEEDASDNGEPQGTGGKRRTRLSNLQTTESLDNILKVEDEDESINFLEIDDTESQESEFKCLNCKAIFASISEIENHLKTCLIEEPKLECDVCGREFERKCSLTYHKRLRHTDREYLQCKTCNFKANNESELRTHCKTAHEILKPFYCDFTGCKYTARSYEFVSRHRKIHKELFDCICENCGRAFSQPSGLISHRRACYKSGQYLCDICGMAFNFLHSMKTHRLAKHLHTKPYGCDTCDARFSDPRNLKRHKRIHEKSFPYCCEICGKFFRHSNSLKEHVVKHIGGSRGNATSRDNEEVEAATGSLVVPNLPSQERASSVLKSTGSGDLTAFASMIVAVNSSTSLELSS